jgi:hypothetical protein
VPTISTVPSKAEAGRCKGRILKRRPLMSGYVRLKMAMARNARRSAVMGSGLLLFALLRFS